MISRCDDDNPRESIWTNCQIITSDNHHIITLIKFSVVSSSPQETAHYSVSGGNPVK